MLRIDKCRNTAELLNLGDAEALSSSADAVPNTSMTRPQSADAERDIERKRACRNRFDLHPRRIS